MGKFIKIPYFLKNDAGSIAIIFALATIPLLLSVGIAVDYSGAVRLRFRAIQAADAALLAAASTVLNEGMIGSASGATKLEEPAIKARLDDVFSNFFDVNMGVSPLYKYNGFKIKYDRRTGDVQVKVDYEYKPVFGGILNTDKISVNVVSSTQMTPAEGGGAVSMFLVLDRSSSMRGSRMTSLKVAVQNMTLQFEGLDPSHKYVRLGAVSYSHFIFIESGLQWGASLVNSSIQSMRAYGSTSSTKAIVVAKDQLLLEKEIIEHKIKNGQEPRRIMVFMTDGKNFRHSDDARTIKVCKQAKENGIEIYTVAFFAPAIGQKLLKSCASSSGHYFNTNNSEELNAAFQEIGAVTTAELYLTK